MNSAQEVRAAALVIGRNLKRNNAVTAALCGAIPGVIAGAAFHPSRRMWIAGLVIGLLWSNAFEYAYHRWLLHWPKSDFGKGHLLHHSTTGKANEPEHVTFGSSPIWIVALFAANGMPTLMLDWRFHLGLSPGILVGFTAYLITVEEIHWRVHLGGWLPWGERVREYHMAHHDIPTGRYNVFFPIFDYVLGNVTPPLEQTEAAAMARAVSQPGVSGESWIWAALAQAALWLWVVGITIGVRYVWTTKGKM